MELMTAANFFLKQQNLFPQDISKKKTRHDNHQLMYDAAHAAATAALSIVLFDGPATSLLF
jgi:hypothetical protein